MTHEKLLELTRTREGKLDYPFLVKIKYSRQPIPYIYGMSSREEAVAFAIAKEEHNPYVRWTEVKEK